jgi:anti-anti-sigma factor
VGKGSRVSDQIKGISVACTNDHVYIRVVGRGTFQNSQPLRRYALEMIEKGYRRFTVDVGGCPNMDSTFLGVLAGIGLRLRQDGQPPNGQVTVANVSARNLDLLQTLGLDRLFTIEPSETAGTHSFLPAGTPLEKLPDSDIESLARPLDKNETTDLMLDAHNNLVRADERNAPKFNSVTKFLRDAVERRRAPDDKK